MYVYRLDLLESSLFICGNSKANEENMMTGLRVHICCWTLLLFVIIVMCIAFYTSDIICCLAVDHYRQAVISC